MSCWGTKIFTRQTLLNLDYVLVTLDEKKPTLNCIELLPRAIFPVLNRNPRYLLPVHKLPLLSCCCVSSTLRKTGSVVYFVRWAQVVQYFLSSDSKRKR